MHSPKIERIEVAARGDVRRAKLYYLRDRVGKRARVRERRYIGPEEVVEPGLLHEAAEADAEAAEAADARGRGRRGRRRPSRPTQRPSREAAAEATEAGGRRRDARRPSAPAQARRRPSSRADDQA